MTHSRLTFVITGLSYAGVEVQMLRVATQLRQRGWQIEVISMTPPQALAEEFADAGIPVTSLDMTPGVPDPRALWRLTTLLRRSRPHIVHAHMVHANILARLVRPFSQIPILISTAHNINEGGRWRELAYRLTDRYTELTVNVSQAAVDRYVEIGAVPREKIRLVPNGVDSEKFAPNPARRTQMRKALGVGDGFTWLAVARFEEAKDYPTMLRAFAQHRQQWPSSRLLLVGRGTTESAMRQLTTELGLDDAIYFLGVRPDIPALMNAADAYLMSSRWEGMPNVLLEASASGLPIVATRVGGNAEVVRDGETGFLVPAGDMAALAGAMARVMRFSVDELAEMGVNARQNMEQEYSLARIVDIWDALYAEFDARYRLAHCSC
ncbi:MAG TPA: glycosyltransferase [Armatimonadota bacterium]